jgi:hypothetical protein
MSVYPHCIRLRGPWECEAAGQPARRVTMPCRWGEGALAELRGRVRFRRRFGYPGRIDSEERVWLTYTAIVGMREVWLNEYALGRHAETFEHDATALLRPRNELVIEVEPPIEPGSLWGEVALEVRRTAFLRGLKGCLKNEDGGTRLHVAGEVVGTSERPLELYVLLGGRTVIYSTVTAAPEGHAFAMVSDAIASQASSSALRVDLIDGGVIWYAAAVALDCS